MTFVCEWCAEGLSPAEIDDEATYPDEQMGGTDSETGGLICEGCADAAAEDEDFVGCKECGWPVAAEPLDEPLCSACDPANQY